MRNKRRVGRRWIGRKPTGSYIETITELTGYHYFLMSKFYNPVITNYMEGWVMDFPDVSHYNGAMSLKGAPAVIAKATEGTGFVDGQFDHYRNEAMTYQIPFVAYHFLTLGPAMDQARNCYSVVGKLPLMVDVETNVNGNKPTLQTLDAFLTYFLGLGGNPRLVYLPYWYWSGVLGSPSLAGVIEARSLRLVSSDYNDTGRSGWDSYGGMFPTIWQYTNKQLFNGQLVDFNRYQGTVDSFRTMVGIGPSPSPSPVTDWSSKVMSTLRVLRRNDAQATADAQVKSAQALINARMGFVPGTSTWVVPDGFFGPKTEAATKTMQHLFQAEMVDGVWGPETWTIGVTGQDLV